MALWSSLEGLGVHILGWFGLSAGLARQLIRFFVVGGGAAIAYVAVMAVVVDGFGGRVLLGAFLAFVLATLVSFVGNALWSFGARMTAAKAAMFFAVNTVGLGLNMAIAWLLDRMGVHYLLIALTVLIVVPMFNFAGHRLITFARSG
ncbi:MAG TPA: GtrA family protein [Reyranella sp.]|nr:GtrA family protein [Reyranella sp.]